MDLILHEEQLHVEKGRRKRMNIEWNKKKK
jgi:hypothetical protein